MILKMLGSDTRQIIELDDRWLLPLGGQVVRRSYVSFIALILELEGNGRDYVVRADGETKARSPSGKEHHVLAEQWKEEAPELISGFKGKVVERGFAYKNGRLELSFEDGSVLEVLSDLDYESWMLSGTGDLRVIGCPGGELAIWRAETEDAP